MLGRMKRITFVVSSLALALGTAQADTPDGPLFDSISMDRQSPHSTLNVDFGFVFFDEPNNTDITAMGITLGGQFVNEQTGLGAYGVLPLSYIGYEDRRVPGVIVEDSSLMVGNVELGGIFSKWMSPGWALVLHGGVALPTAEDDDVLDFASAWGSSPRYTDIVHRVPNSTWLRFGISPMGRSGGLFWRVDLGLDLALDEDNGAQNISPIMRFNAGGGFDLGKVHLLGELSLLNVDDERDNNDDDTTGTVALGARFVSGNVYPGLALILPIEFDTFYQYEPEFAIAATLVAHFR